MMASLLYETLKVLFARPIVILMLGEWQSGKTDTSFLMGYLAKKWKLIDKIGSNTWTFNDPNVDFINAMDSLRAWLHADRLRKLFIFDEGLKHVYRRKAMSQMNVDVITDILPELSKGRGRMIVCSQIEKLDSDIMHPAFTRAVWRKRSKKVMECVSKHHPPRTFRNLPRSPIRFDPYRIAPFLHKKMSKESGKVNRGRAYEIAKLRVAGWTLAEIGDKFDLHVEQVRRELKKGLKGFIEFTDAKEVEGESVSNISSP